MASSSKILALLFIISFLSISAATTTTPEEVDSDNPVTPQFFGFFHIPRIIRRRPKIIGLPLPRLLLQPPPVQTPVPDLPLQPPPVETPVPDLPLQSPPVEGQLHNNDDLPAMSCPIDTQKLGACMDLIELKPSAMNKCCPIFDGLVEAEVAVCMCTTLKEKALDLKVFVPIALQLLANCGKTLPSSYTCSLTL